jgi:hypothetical protein
MGSQFDRIGLIYRAPNLDLDNCMRPTKTELRYEALAALAVAIAIYFAFKIVGFLGVGILGLGILFIAVQADINKDETSVVWAMRPEPQHRMDHAEKAARRAENNSLAHPILMGKLLGLCLAVIGLGLFFFL